MEKFIYIIKSLSSLNGVNGVSKRVDNIYAESSEEKAIEDVERLTKEAKTGEFVEGHKVWYIYEKIKLYD